MQKKSIIMRFFLSYFCILIPTLLVSFLVSGNIFNRLKDKDERVAESQVERINEELDYLKITYSEKSIRLSGNANLQPYRMKDAVYAKNGIAILYDAAFFDTMATDYFIYYGEGKIYSSDGMTSTEWYFTNELGCTKESAESAVDLIASRENGECFIRKGEADGFLILHYPVSKNSLLNTHEASVNFCISYKTLGNMLERLTDTNPSYINLTLARGETVHFYGDSEKGLTVISPKDYLDEQEKNKYTLLKQEMSSIKGTIEVLYNSENLYADVKEGQMINYIIIICGLFFSTIMAFILSKYRERQLHQLESFASGHIHHEFSMKNEFGYVKSIIFKNMEENRTMRQDLIQYHQAFRKQTAMLVFHGVLPDIATIESFLSSCGMDLCEEYYYLGGLFFPEKADEEAVKAAESLVAGSLNYTVSFGSRKVLLFLVELAHRDKMKGLRTEMAKKMYSVLQKWDGCEIRLSFSQVYQNITMANYAYMEVMSMMDQTVASGSCSSWFVCWEDVPEQTQRGLCLDQNLLEEFLYAIEHYHSEKALQALNKLNRQITTEKLSDANKNYLRYSILQTILKAMHRTAGGMDDRLQSDIMQIDASNEEQFVKSVRLVLLRYFTENPKDDFLKIVRYIQDNYYKSDLTAEEVAGYAGLSKNYLSSLFRSRLGVSYIEYLTKIRMEKACELLGKTDLSVASIVQRVGYIDQSTFRRKFKSIHGNSVSEYRMQIRESE